MMTKLIVVMILKWFTPEGAAVMLSMMPQNVSDPAFLGMVGVRLTADQAEQ